MDKFPPPYDALPESLRQTIWNTYQGKTDKNPYFGWELGFKDNHIRLSLEELLKKMDAAGRLQVLKEVHGRSVILPQVWSQIKAIYDIWDYPAGNNVSQGFACELNDAEGLRTLLRSDAAKDKFCEDPISAHRPSDTFRELIKSGPGLHVCLMPKGHADSHVHGIHIDKFQMVCTRKGDGKCDYQYANRQTYDHMKDAGPWYIREKILKRAREKLPSLPKLPF